jgi:hypothetical protein
MAQQNTKHIGERPTIKQSDKIEILHDTWTIMKPLVHFSVKAMKVLAHALIFIVKNIPKPEGNKTSEKGSNRVIKV